MKTHCKTGEVVKMVTKNGKTIPTCVQVTGSLLDDGDLYHQGWVLAKAGEYEWAIQVLSSVKNQNDPDVLNMLGYSNRKAGRLELGISYYDKALAMKPDFARAREYLGEGYVAAGKVDLAKNQLGEIQKICGTTCEEYKDLSKVIDSSTL
jgi:tetratricopeptide (TPR) repeat protein